MNLLACPFSCLDSCFESGLNNSVYLIICGVLSLLVLAGIAMMSKVKTATQGNTLSALAILLGIIITLLKENIVSLGSIYIALAIGSIVGALLAKRVKMIQMPQLVALLNGIGGGASALVGLLSLHTGDSFSVFTGFLAVFIGIVTLVGSLVAAGKLHRVLPQKPQIWNFHSLITVLSIVLTLVFCVVGTLYKDLNTAVWIMAIGTVILSSIFGLYFSIRVGGADMPITISLLNSLSGVAGAIAGMAISDLLLVSVGAIVGASGLLLTQIMCRAMNRNLSSILFARGYKPSLTAKTTQQKQEVASHTTKTHDKVETPIQEAANVLSAAKEVIIVPGYGMALAQAQHLVKQLADKLQENGARVRYAIHPVAGRMPGHMNVLLAEANVDYDVLFEMDQINDDFEKADAVVVIGANDVLNPAARDAEGTPIYGMPVLNVDKAKHVIICNYDLNPGYAGVPNPLYSKENGVSLLIGDAKETLGGLLKSV